MQSSTTQTDCDTRLTGTSWCLADQRTSEVIKQLRSLSLFKTLLKCFGFIGLTSVWRAAGRTVLNQIRTINYICSCACEGVCKFKYDIDVQG